MAKFKIGQGITLDAAVMPTESHIVRHEIPAAIVDDSRLEKLSDTCFSNEEKINKLANRLDSHEEKIDLNYENIIEVMHSLNSLDMTVDIVKQRKEVVVSSEHRDHTKDFEAIYEKIYLDKDDMIERVVSKADEASLILTIKKQKRVNLFLGALAIASLILHLF